MDLKDQRVVIGAGTADVDYNINFNGQSNQGDITYMEDEDQFLFDAATVAPVVAVTSTDTISGSYPVGSMFVRIVGGDTSMWVKIRMDGVLSARWKKLTP
jgi:hypothetical protein